MHATFRVFQLVIIVCLLLAAEQTNSQTTYFQTGTTQTMLSNVGGITGKVGVGTTNPSAKLNVCSNNGITTTPVFEVNPVTGLGLSQGSIKHFVTIGTQTYGIHQTSTISNVLNYFQDPVKTGYIQLQKGNSNNAVIGIQPGVNQLNFTMDCNPSCDGFTPLTMTFEGVRVQPKLTTDYFQLLTNPGANKILVSDNLGNGTWTDPLTMYDRTWIRNSSDGLFANCTGNVGIGTQTPIAQFQVENGASKLGFGSAYSRELLYGTGYIGFNAARYLNGSTYKWLFTSDDAHNGGAVMYGDIFGNMFFAPITTSNPGSGNQVLTDYDIRSNIKMVIDRTGKLGIGTISPLDRFQVNSSYIKVGIGSANSEELNYGTGYIGFNGIRQDDGINPNWVFNSDYMHNGGGVIWSDISGNMYFASIGNSESSGSDQYLTDAEIKSKIQMSIFSNGKVAIGTDKIPGNHTLYVKGGILTEELQVQLLSNWADTVFTSTYKKMPLFELENFVMEHHHLPEVPTKDQVKAEGLNVAEMNTLLLKKVEELTLYIFDLKKEIDDMKHEEHNSLIRKNN